MEGDAVDWWSEAVTAGVVLLFTALLGAVVGLIWHAAAPQVDVQGVLRGSDSANKALIGDDVWLGALGIGAGVLCVAVLALVAPRAVDGPGAMTGLAFGGFLGMLVADRVGHLLGVPGLVSAIRAAFPDATDDGIGYVVGVYDFKVRATALLLTWPFVSVLLGAMVTWVRAVNRPTGTVVTTYAG